MSAPLFPLHNKSPLRLPPKKLLKGVDMSMLGILFFISKRHETPTNRMHKALSQPQDGALARRGDFICEIEKQR